MRTEPYTATSTFSNDALTVHCHNPANAWIELAMETNGEPNGTITIRHLEQAEALVLMLQQVIRAAHGAGA